MMSHCARRFEASHTFIPADGFIPFPGCGMLMLQMFTLGPHQEAMPRGLPRGLQ
jgi:hypothetical protein